MIGLSLIGRTLKFNPSLSNLPRRRVPSSSSKRTVPLQIISRSEALPEASEPGQAQRAQSDSSQVAKRSTTDFAPSLLCIKPLKALW